MAFKMIFNPYLNNEQIDLSLFKNSFGLKSLGLLKILEYTPKFLLLSNELFKLSKGDNNIFKKNLKNVVQEIISVFGSEEEIIIRSSGIDENINQRGMFSSKIILAGLNEINLNKTINSLYFDFENNKLSEESTICLIVQIYIKPIAKGHLSNERRVSRNNNTWVYEIEESNLNHLKNIDRIRSKKTKSTQKINMFLQSSKEIEIVLRNFSGIFIEDDKRFHIEWVYGKSKMYIVQIDTENKFEGITPGSRWKYNRINTSNEYYKILKSVSEFGSNWKKLKSVETFKKCNLPHGNIFILQDENIFNQITNDVFVTDLEEDLKKLLQNPIVIRTDCNEMENTFLLPRTTTISLIKECKFFLSNTLKKFKKEGVAFHNICFLMHHYISSKACALTLAKPDIPRVRVDSTWGLPDGLHCFPYDTFEVNVFTEEVKKTLNSKHEYLDCNLEGDWIAVKSGWDWDWKPSLTENQLDKIANFSYEVAKELNKPVGIMFFVGVDELTLYPEVLPWYYTLEVPDSTFEASEIIFPKKTFIISEPKELNQLKQSALSKDTVVKLKLNPKHIRNHKFITEIGQYLSKKDIPLILEGSILSHVFYILKRLNVNLKCTDPFKIDYPKQSFNKLVRDLIPTKISSHGELPIIQSLSKDLLVDKLKGKAIEEAYELFREKDKDNILEEMADLYEILISLSTLLGESFEKVIN
ncbi:nucleoside triphosphate pyrophosphohydrolase, partial [Pontimicrobium sp. MEBiC01747]